MDKSNAAAGIAANSTGAQVLRIIRALDDRPLLYLGQDEGAAEALADTLAALVPELIVIYLPSSDTLPGDDQPASPANVGRRVSALRRLRATFGDRDGPSVVVVTTGEAAARRYPAPAAFDAAPPSLHLGDTLDRDLFLEEALAYGYFADDRIDEPGEVAIRGEVIDLYPADAGGPVRIDLDDGRIGAIHRFDPITQLRGEPIESIEIGRAAEPDGDQDATLLDHLAPGTILISSAAEKRRKRFVALAERVGTENGKPADTVGETRWSKALNGWSIETDDTSDLISPIPRFAEEASPGRAVQRFLAAELQTDRTIVIAGGDRDLRFLRLRLGKALSAVDWIEEGSLLAGCDARNTIFLLSAPLDQGARDDTHTLIAAADILGTRAKIEPGRSAHRAIGLGGSEIRKGDLVIHEDHGFAKLIGLESAPGDEEGEVIALEYADEARRLVPVRDAGLLWRYGSDSDGVKLDKLEGKGWTKRRIAIDKAIGEAARSLIELAEERADATAPAMDPDPVGYERFVAGFPYTETADQAHAIAAVRNDLESGKPMERLIIGDVGFGKTEIALRAAAITALAGYQVIVAAPTTVLARQHLDEFTRRFKGTGIRVAGLSRLTEAAEKKAVVAGLADGSIDVVVGTAAVVAKTVRYANLGLVVIDEEQRFGAADKAKLRGRPDRHLLIMSATPIPRTLHRAMIGLQQVSIIATPPARRQPIRTTVVCLDEPVIGLALRREKMRKGQSFLVVPRIADLPEMRKMLGREVPDLAIVEAHGKMPGKELDEAMVRFAAGNGDILLATNIIETGLDVPRANTMIIWRPDRFGLSQLHQLRGRVGRGRRRGQVLLAISGEGVSQATQKRLRTLETFDQLGSGFAIAGADLGQRGGGDVLSDAQAGHMKLIGVELYQHLLEGALRHARGEEARDWYPELRTGTVGSLPPEWIPEEEVRLNLYLRLARLADRSERHAFENELADRFGPLPDPAVALLERARLAMLAIEVGIRSVSAGPAAIALVPAKGVEAKLEEADLVASDRRWLARADAPYSNPTAAAIDVLEGLLGS